jgi:hypothetical protein
MLFIVNYCEKGEFKKAHIIKYSPFASKELFYLLSILQNSSITSDMFSKTRFMTKIFSNENKPSVKPPEISKKFDGGIIDDEELKIAQFVSLSLGDGENVEIKEDDEIDLTEHLKNIIKKFDCMIYTPIGVDFDSKKVLTRSFKMKPELLLKRSFLSNTISGFVNKIMNTYNSSFKYHRDFIFEYILSRSTCHIATPLVDKDSEETPSYNSCFFKLKILDMLVFNLMRSYTCSLEVCLFVFMKVFFFFLVVIFVMAFVPYPTWSVYKFY